MPPTVFRESLEIGCRVESTTRIEEKHGPMVPLKNPVCFQRSQQGFDALRQ